MDWKVYVIWLILYIDDGDRERMLGGFCELYENVISYVLWVIVVYYFKNLEKWML